MWVPRNRPGNRYPISLTRLVNPRIAAVRSFHDVHEMNACKSESWSCLSARIVMKRTVNIMPFDATPVHI
jgi:hypothetical protein